MGVPSDGPARLEISNDHVDRLRGQQAETSQVCARQIMVRADYQESRELRRCYIEIGKRPIE